MVPGHADSFPLSRDFWRTKLFEKAFPGWFIDFVLAKRMNWSVIVPELFDGKVRAREQDEVGRALCHAMLARLMVMAFEESASREIREAIRWSLRRDGFDASKEKLPTMEDPLTGEGFLAEGQALEYLELLPRLREYQARIRDRLQHAVSGRAEIASRIKTWETVREKLRKNKESRISDISDLVAFRVVVPDLHYLFKISDAIRSEFRIKSMESVTLAVGETATHFVLQGGSPALGFSAEIQLLTAAEDARRKLQHELAYRAEPIDPTPEPVTEAQIGSLDEAIGKLESVIADFKTLIERGDVHEKGDVHPFLERNTFFSFQILTALCQRLRLA